MKIIKISILLLVILLIITFIILLFHYDIKDILYSSKPVEMEDFTDTDQISDSLKIRRLEIDNLYWKNRIEMANDKSIDLLIDFVSPEVSLEIEGILVYNAPVKNYITLIYYLPLDILQ